MNNLPLVSIVIPVYNREKLILESVNSALCQTYANFEIVIVDNNSTDKTWEVLCSLAIRNNNIKIFQNNQNIGPVRNWKKCFEYADGEYIKILWSDDLIDRNFISLTIAHFDKETAFVISGINVFNEKGVIFETTFKGLDIIPSNFFIEDITIGETDLPVSPGCAIFRKKDLVQNLLIDIPNNDCLDFSKFGAGNDLLLFLLIAQEYSHVKIIKKVLSHFRSHKDSITIKNNGNLNIFYDWAIYYFLNQYNDIKLLKKFKAKILGKIFIKKNYLNLYFSIKENPDYLYLFKRILNKLKNI